MSKRHTGGRRSVWRITNWPEGFELPESMVSFDDRAPLYLQWPIGRCDDFAIDLAQKIARLSGPRRVENEWAFFKLLVIAANRGRRFRGYLLIGDRKPAEGKHIAEWLELPMRRVSSIIKKLSSVGLIERVSLPKFPELPRPRRRKRTNPLKGPSKSGDRDDKKRKGAQKRAPSGAHNASQGGNGGPLRAPLSDNQKNNRQSENQKEEQNINPAIGRRSEAEGTGAALKAPPPCAEAQGAMPNAEGASPQNQEQADRVRQGPRPIQQQIEAMKAAEAAEGALPHAERQGQGTGQGPLPPQVPGQSPTLPNTPNVVERSPGGSPGSGRPTRRGTSVPHPLADDIRSFMASYSEDAGRFAQRIYAELRVRDEHGAAIPPDSPAGHRQLAGFASAWASAELGGLDGQQRLALWNKSIKSASRLSQKPASYFKKSREATWRHEFNERLAAYQQGKGAAANG